MTTNETEQNIGQNTEQNTEANPEEKFTPVTSDEMYEREDESDVHKIPAGSTIRGKFVGFFESEGIDRDGKNTGEKWLQIGLSIDHVEGTQMYRCSKGLKNALKRSSVRETDIIEIHRTGSGIMDTVWTINKVIRE